MISSVTHWGSKLSLHRQRPPSHKLYFSTFSKFENKLMRHVRLATNVIFKISIVKKLSF